MVSESLQTSAEPDDLPPFHPPEPVMPAGDASPSGLGTTRSAPGGDFAGQCRTLRASKAYGGAEDGSPQGGDGDDR
jgi:hypothetical protein